MQQHTIAREEEFVGIALHSGGEVRVRLLPAAENTGIVFRRRDLGGEIKADCQAVADTNLATTLQGGGIAVGMVEHLLSALAANRVDNLIVELDGAEVPVLDGSAAPWQLLLNACGRAPQAAARRTIRVLQPVRVEAGGGEFAEFAPAGESSYHVTIDYPHKVVNSTGVEYDFLLTESGYAGEIVRARTFCYVGDVEIMHRSNRALGGSLQNAVVYNDETVINEGGLRYPDEFVRHKVLDAIGDCFINGHVVTGSYRSHKPGHGLNNRLMRALMANPQAWEWSEAAAPAAGAA